MLSDCKFCLLSEGIETYVDFAFLLFKNKKKFRTNICLFTGSTELFKKLSNCNPHMKAYLKTAIPDRLHYRHNKRVQPILLIADEGWTIVQKGNLPRCKWCLIKLEFLDACIMLA